MTSKKAASLTGTLFAAKGAARPAMEDRFLFDGRENPAPRTLTHASAAASAMIVPRPTEAIDLPIIETSREATRLDPVLTLDDEVVYVATNHPVRRQRHLRLVYSAVAAAFVAVGLWFASSAVVGGAGEGTAAVAQSGGSGANDGTAPVATAPIRPAEPQPLQSAAGAVPGISVAHAAVAPAVGWSADWPPRPAPKPDALTPGDGRGDYVIQLSSVGTAMAAEQEWMKFQEIFPELLSDMSFTAQRTARRDMGVVYGVQTGPFADLGSARAMCAQIKAREQECLVIKR